MKLAIEHLLQDPEITEIMIAGYDHILIERRGKLEDVPSPYRDAAHLTQEVMLIAEALGRVPSESDPIMDLRLEDSSRVNIVMPPIAVHNGPAVTIRKLTKRDITIEDLIGYGSWTEQMVTFLRACVRANLNILIAGGTGSGKTTVMNLICGMISPTDRVVAVEHAAELYLPLPRVVRLEARPANIEGRGEVTLADLTINAMKMRPDHILCGEVHGAEAYYLMQAMSTGYDGSMCTMHANSPRDTLARLELMMAEGSPTTPLLGLRQMIASGLNLIAYQERMVDGARRMTRISEVAGLQGDTILLNDIFEFRQTGMKDGKILGYHTPTGYIPRFLPRFQMVGIDLPVQEFFTPR